MFVPRVLDSWIPALPTISPETQDRVKGVATQCLKELALSLSMKLVISAFVVTPAGLSFLFTTSLIQLAASAVFHSIDTQTLLGSFWWLRASGLREYKR